jgi:hypothetical protein
MDQQFFIRNSTTIDTNLITDFPNDHGFRKHQNRDHYEKRKQYASFNNMVNNQKKLSIKKNPRFAVRENS